MLSLTFQTPEALIERIENAVLTDWRESGKLFGLTHDPILNAEEDGWAVVRAPGCHVSVSREPFMLWLNPLECRVLEWPPERRAKVRSSLSRLQEIVPGSTRDLMVTALQRLGLGEDAPALAEKWLDPIDWTLASIQPEIADQAQRLLDHWDSETSLTQRVESELSAAADAGGHVWGVRTRAQMLLLRLMLRPAAPTGPELRTAARGALECLSHLTEEMLRASITALLRDPAIHGPFRESLTIFHALMDRCAHMLVLPGTRHPFPTVGGTNPHQIRFAFPHRLLWLWMRRARAVTGAVRERNVPDFVDPDLLSVQRQVLDDHRHERVGKVALLAAVMLQNDQGPPDAQEEMAELAREVLDPLLHPEQIGLRVSDRGRRLAELHRLIPRALAMGRELASRGLNLAMVRPDLLAAHERERGTVVHRFPFKLGPEQPLPCAPLFVAERFDDIAPLFGSAS